MPRETIDSSNLITQVGSYEIADREGYLARMAAPLQEKLKMLRYFPKNPRRILDVGCADGILTRAIAEMYYRECPDNPPQVLGIDLDQGFIDLARMESAGIPNIEFRKNWLRDMVDGVYQGKPRYDVVSFFSVLHEFYTYGEGMPSVMKAMADAHQVLEIDGVLPIRDMILHKSAYESDFQVPQVLKKVDARDFVHPFLEEHQERFGKVRTVADMNHFLLKYFYTDNWQREGKENYIPVPMEDYLQMFRLLDMQVLHQDLYLMPYLKNRWKRDFDLSEDEVDIFKSTGHLIAKKRVQAIEGVPVNRLV